MHGTLRLRLAKLTRHDLDHVTALIKTRLKRMQNPHDLFGGLVAKTGPAPRPPRPQPLKISRGQAGGRTRVGSE